MKPKTPRKRLDAVLVERGLAQSLAKAQAMALAGEVQVDGVRVDKAGASIKADSRVELFDRLQKYASRGGFKLEGALSDFGLSVTGRVCLDVGSSTGGFTDCLLQQGALRVYCVDVNISQLAWKLQQDQRVLRVKRNARDLQRKDLGEQIELAVADVSFISVRKILGPVASVLKPESDFLVLVKPQFELRRTDVPSGGIVEDSALQRQAVETVRAECESHGLKVLAVCPSHLAGAEGNQEYFLHTCKKPLE